MNLICREPHQSNDDAGTAYSEEHCSDSNQDLTHRVTPKRDAACGTSRIDTSVPVENYGPIGSGEPVMADTG